MLKLLVVFATAVSIASSLTVKYQRLCLDLCQDRQYGCNIACNHRRKDSPDTYKECTDNCVNKDDACQSVCEAASLACSVRCEDPRCFVDCFPQEFVL